MPEPTGRTTDHANELDSSHAGEHARDRVITALLASWRIAPDNTSQATARRTAERDTDTMLAALPELAELDRLRSDQTAMRRIRTAIINVYGKECDSDDIAAMVDQLLAHMSEYEAHARRILTAKGEALAQAVTERDTAQAAITRVRALHTHGPRTNTCNECGMFWPCDTITALTPPSTPESTEETDHG